MAKRLTIPDEDLPTFTQILEDGLNSPLYQYAGAKLSDDFLAYLNEWLKEHNDK